MTEPTELTEDQLLERVKARDACPYCGNPDIEPGKIQQEDTRLYQRVNCTDCERDYVLAYELDGLFE